MKLERLIYLCKKRDFKAQTILYEKYKDFLFTVSLKYCKNREEAQDNLQDAFIEIFNNINKFKGKGTFEGWIKRITINKAVDKYKKNVFQYPVKEDINLIEDVEVDSLTNLIPISTILKFIQELPDRYRICFNLYYLDGYSHKEISEILLISEGTSKSNTYRAKLILKDKLQAYRKNEMAI